jgi:hypothetical protein
MHNGDRNSANTERSRPAGRSPEADVLHSGTTQPKGQPVPASARAPRKPESKRPWASRRATGPSWADTIEPF